MRNHYVAVAATALLVASASGCQSGMPRWDWWRSTSKVDASHASSVASNTAPKYPQLPSAAATPSTTGSEVQPGTSAPPSAYAGGAAAGDSAAVASALPQTSPYDPAGYPGAGAGTPRVAQNPYAATGGSYPETTPATTPNPYAVTPSSYPTASDGLPTSYDGGAGAAPAGGGYYAAPAGPANYNPPGDVGAGYSTGSPYDPVVGNRYSAGADSTASPAAAQYPSTAPGGGPSYPSATPPANYNTYPGATDSQYPPAGGAYPSTGSNYPTTGASYETTSGPAASTADTRSNYGGGTTQPSGTGYLPAGTKSYEPINRSATPGSTSPAPPSDTSGPRPGTYGLSDPFEARSNS